MIHVSELIKTNNFTTSCKLLLTVHDELLFEVLEDKIEAIVPLIKNSMEHVCPLSVPLKVAVKIGKRFVLNFHFAHILIRWGSLKPYEINK
jgi:DNA polymerase-1